MSYGKPNGSSIQDFEIADFIRLPGVFTIATLPVRPTTRASQSVSGVLAFTSDGGYYYWSSITFTWTSLGGNGSSAGPSNTPGTGAAVVTDNAPAATLTDYSPTGYGILTSSLSIVTSAATTLNSIAAAGRSEGSMLALDNDGTGDVTIPNAGPGTAGNLFVVPAAYAPYILPAQGSCLIRRHGGAWRPV